MVGKGHWELLKSFAESQKFSPSIQKVVLYLLEQERPLFRITPEIEETLGFVDWLSNGEESALTVRDDVRLRVDTESSVSTMRDEAMKHYKKNDGKRKKLPIFYRNGYFLLTLLGNDFLKQWAPMHSRFVEYQKAKQTSSPDHIQSRAPAVVVEVRV